MTETSYVVETAAETIARPGWADELIRHKHLSRCSQCGFLAEPSEIEPDFVGSFAVYDHCGITWTLGWDDLATEPARGRHAANRAYQLQPVKRKRSKLPFRKVWDRDGWQCVRCGTHKNLTVDHIAPVSRGGTDDLANLQTMCGSCNSSKGNRV